MDIIASKEATIRPDLERPLAAKLSLYLSLSDPENEALEGLSGSTVRFSRATSIVNEGDEQAYVYVLKTGWCSCARHLSDGRRQITRFAMPGDFLCFDALVAKAAVQDIVALSDVTLVQLKLDQLGQLAVQSPRLAVGMLWVAAQDESALAERLTSLGRRFALERLAHLFVETYYRLNALRLAHDQRFFFPVTKEQLADAMGLTTIHIYRTLRRLSEDGLLKLEGNWVDILDLDGLQAVGKFDSLYLRPDTMSDETQRVISSVG
jgi:CRP-like cAMP-binding protein